MKDVSDLARFNSALKTCAELAYDPAGNFFVQTGVFNLCVAAFDTADDLTDVIESLRLAKRYAESDRLRDLQSRLYAAAKPLSAVAARPVDWSVRR